MIGRVITNIALLPASIRREAGKLFSEWTNRSSDGPQDDPTPTGPPAPVVDLAEERNRQHQVAEERAVVGLEKYPAKRNPNAKRRK